MSSVSEDEQERGFARIARQLNYSRRFMSPHEVVVTIPTISFQSFSNTGTGVIPWRLFRLFESCRAFTFWPIPHADRPNSSLLDSHRLINDNFTFIASAKMEIHPSFHERDTPKFPLDVNVKVTRVGRSSKRIAYTLSQVSAHVPYATFIADDVLVDGKTRRPTAYPAWWCDKYGYLRTSDRGTLVQKLIRPANVLKSHVKVQLEDIDSNLHTNFASYLKWSYAALDKHVRHGNVRISWTMSSVSLKSVGMLFLTDSNLDTVLTVLLWKDEKRDNIIKCIVINSEGTDCCHVEMEFYVSERVTSNL